MDKNSFNKNKKQKGNIKDVLLQVKEDRRLLPNVPDKTQNRSNLDRRGQNYVNDSYNVDINDFIKTKSSGIRYNVSYDVEVLCIGNNARHKFTSYGIDISMTGILLKLEDKNDLEILKKADKIKITFEIAPGSMPEGMEMKVKMFSELVRVQEMPDGTIFCGLKFEEELSSYGARKKDRYMIVISSILLFFIAAFILLMRAESVIYFRFNKWLYLYSIAAAFFLLSRYGFAVFYKEVPIDASFTPGVTIIIPCFNEEKWIKRTIRSCIGQDYPIDELEVIVVDDHSTDNSREMIKEAIDELHGEAEQFEIKKRLKYIFLEQNVGKRDALAEGVKKAKHDYVVFVDSDSFLDPYAIRSLVQPFKDPKMAGVSGRVDVANTYTNVLTKIQSVRYYIAFRVMKAAESVFDTVSCLSGPLSCYKKELVIDNFDPWLNQKFLGHKATFGDDRALTNLILKKYRTRYQDSAICYTIVPNDHMTFLKQQMRWKRSWLRESIIGSKFMWKKESFASLTFYMGVIIPIFAPIVFSYNLIYVPLAHNIFPTTFLAGLFLMASLMSAAQLFLRRSTTWIFGMLFCLYYEAVLLWQMPIAWVTFWKSTWGTRATPSDVEASKKKSNTFKTLRGDFCK